MSQHTNRRSTVVVAIGMLAVASTGHGMTVLYVDDDALPGGDGLAWDTAYRFLQDALTDLATGGEVSEIRVAQGSYLPDRDEANPTGTGNRQATFQLTNGVALLGGYAGLGAPDPDERDIQLHETILSGDLAEDDGPDFANNDENSYHVVSGSDIDESAALDGLTICGGNADGPSSTPHRRGGGMYNLAGSPTVANCTFSGNAAVSGGGGMSNWYASSPTVTGCAFTGNTTYRGGAMDNRHASSPMVTGCSFTGNSGGGMENSRDSNPTVTGCTFSGNDSRWGGMYNLLYSNPVVSGCTFTGNSDGGMRNYFHCSPVVSGCTFSGNDGDEGGGMYNRSDSNAVVSGCTFSGNTANIGGGMYNRRSNPVVTNCSFSGNAALDSNGGGMFNEDNAGPTVSGCTFSANTAGAGGGMYNDGSNPTVFDCTFSGNSASSGNALAFGSESHESPSDLFMANCILWDGGDEVWNGDGSTITIIYSDVQGGWSGDGSNNIDADPLFVDPANGDLRLSPDSPCLDAGHNWAVAPDLADLDADGDTHELTPLDLDGNPRFVHAPIDPHPGCGIPAIVDMGAYELPDGTAVDIRLGDIDGNGAAGYIDFLLLLDAWGVSAAGCCLADFDLDGVVGVLDFLKLLQYWG